jgi:hypothetical protein
MEDITGWYASAIRNGTYLENNGSRQLSNEFTAWLEHRAGSVVIKTDPGYSSSNSVFWPYTLIYFQQQEDLVDYLLTFAETPTLTTVFYSPYIK